MGAPSTYSAPAPQARPTEIAEPAVSVDAEQATADTAAPEEEPAATETPAE